ncbi:replication-associated recombination protein A [Candidatus Uhrbacteria bacterium]|nr:replication-associated recombination protein A [Candidatus Uhrbacteria bacterium]
MNTIGPLADRMRPRTIEEFVGQFHLLKQGGVLSTMISQKTIFSLILWGPPGTGKTTLAKILAANAAAEFVQLSAVTSGVKDVRAVITAAKQNQLLDKRTILFVDELHRFNKAQQDAFLPHVESGTITFIGATTENPSFEVIAPLLSRSRVLHLRPLSVEDLEILLERSLSDPDRGIAGVTMASEARLALIRASGGDARTLLNALELSATLARGADGLITTEHIKEALQSKTVLYDRAGEGHHNTISAFIKSMRGSDANATLYYLCRMIEGGEDPLFIARRMVVFASEDVGLADFRGLLVAVAAFQACERVGYPECQLTLAHAATYLAQAKKSRAVVNAIPKAMEAVAKTRDVPIPLHLRNAFTRLMKEEGYAQGYTWSGGLPHIEDETKGFLPDELTGEDFFTV